MSATRSRKDAREKRPVRDARLPPQQRRTQLLACAMKVFAEHGLGAANHALIAAEAQVSVPTVFFYFKTRAKLVDAVLTEVEHFFGSTFESASHDDRPADEALLQLSRTMMQGMESHPYHLRVFLEWSIAMRPEIWPRYLALHRRILAVLTRMIERGQRQGRFRPDLIPEDEAQIVHSASYALFQMKLAGAPAARIARFQQSMFQVLTPSSRAGPAQRAPTRAAARRRRPAAP